MLKMVINGHEIEVQEGMTVMQACESIGIEIPHFCFHERLNIAGNCRMCLVEMEKFPKPIASCAMPVSNGMVIHTNTPKVQKARENVLELILINHPLDCPICDQAGECDLQDQTFKYGKGTNKFHENKRSVKDKYMGPLIKTHMTRCIHCTRCVRFTTEVAGVAELGTIGRGEDMEITSYLEKSLTSELSGNMIDLCPVGALTSKPFAFRARKWELEKTESVDILDAVGSNIRIDSRGLEVMRILPKLNESINEEWISDKARFSYDGLKNQRLDKPYIKINGKLKECSWHEALATIASKLRSLNGSEMAALAGDLACVESMYLLKKLFNKLGCYNLDANQSNYKIDQSARGNYLFNTTIEGIENADLCLLIGANPRQVAPILNARIGKAQRQNGMVVARIGEINNQTYNILELGSNPKIIELIIAGKHEFSALLKKKARPMIIVGDSVLKREDGYALLSAIHELIHEYNIVRNDWNGFNILHNHASLVGSLDIGFAPTTNSFNNEKIIQGAEEGTIKFIYLLGADEIDKKKLSNTFIVYQGHHGDVGATIADVILPGAAYTEKSATYVNLEGRPQYTRAAVPPPGDAKEDWFIINDLIHLLDIKNDIVTLEDVRKEIKNFSAIFQNMDILVQNNFVKFRSEDKILYNQPIKLLPIDYYLTNVISRASITMAKCSNALLEQTTV